MKRQHPADAIAEEQMISAIRSADRFVASVFVGRGQYVTGSAPNVIAALNIAYQLEADPRAFTRRATISAVSKEGVATFLSNELLARLGVNRKS